MMNRIQSHHARASTRLRRKYVTCSFALIALFTDPKITVFRHGEFIIDRTNVVEFSLASEQPLIFKKSVTISSRVISSTHNPNLLIYQQVQEYTVKLLGMKRVNLWDVPRPVIS